MTNNPSSSDDIKVSIICNAYNQESYIRETLDSILSQKTTFRFEVLVHDDASTDGTALIIEEYKKRYPDIIKPVYQQENKYSKGIGISTTYQYPRANGVYLALCEGDDYWIDEYKLQKQVDALEKNPEINICTCRTLKLLNGRKKGWAAPADKNMILSPEQVISGGGGFVGTNSIMLRKEAFLNHKLYGKLMALDYFTQIIGSIPNGMMYLNDCMCVYRLSARGSWTRRMNKNVKARIHHSERVIDSLRILDKIYNGRYHDSIQKMITQIEFDNLIRNHDFRALKQEPYSEIYKSKSFIYRMKLKFKQIFTFLGIKYE